MEKNFLLYPIPLDIYFISKLQGMADLVAMDLVPEPTILAAALRACRRVNDYSLTTRILEITKVKCGDKEAEFWPYIMQVS